MIILAALLALLPNEAALHRMSARFAPTEVSANLAVLPVSEREALTKIVAAARLFDTLFLRQVWAGNEPLLLSLAQDHSTLGRERLHAFVINKGPWSALDGDASFIPGAPEQKPLQANFYPLDATKQEVEEWQKTAPASTGFFTSVRRGPDRKLIAIPYSLEYAGELSQAAALLREAAALTQQPTLRTFLEKRAAAFLSNDYYDSDVAWMELDASIEPTLGPYEVYQDGWFNQKAAFEAFIALRDEAASQKLSSLSKELQGIEDALPIDPKLRNPKLGTLAPIRVVNVVFTAGDANHGVQTAAYNLPNDERIAQERGTKRVLLKNVQEAKFRKTLVPISQVALAPRDRKEVSFDAFFTHILMHELMHGLGPHQASTGGTVRHAMQEAGSALEEAKADIAGLFAMQKLVDSGALDKSLGRTLYTTFLASSFRSIRFGINEAHGKGQALQLNRLLDDGAVVVAKDGTFSVDAKKIRASVTQLTSDIMTLQESGDVAKARAWLSKEGVIRPAVQHVLDRLASIPVDIEPIYSRR